MVFIYNIIYSFSWVICEVVHVIHPFSRIWEIPLLSFFFQLYWANTLEFSSQAKKFYLTSWGIIMLIRISNFLSWLSFISKSSSRIWLKMTKILTPLISRREPRHPSEQADSICIYGCKFTTTHRCKHNTNLSVNLLLSPPLTCVEILKILEVLHFYTQILSVKMIKKICEGVSNSHWTLTDCQQYEPNCPCTCMVQELQIRQVVGWFKMICYELLHHKIE